MYIFKAEIKEKNCEVVTSILNDTFTDLKFTYFSRKKLIYDNYIHNIMILEHSPAADV